MWKVIFFAMLKKRGHIQNIFWKVEADIFIVWSYSEENHEHKFRNSSSKLDPIRMWKLILSKYWTSELYSWYINFYVISNCIAVLLLFGPVFEEPNIPIKIHQKISRKSIKSEILDNGLILADFYFHFYPDVC